MDRAPRTVASVAYFGRARDGRGRHGLFEVVQSAVPSGPTPYRTVPHRIRLPAGGSEPAGRDGRILFPGFPKQGGARRSRFREGRIVLAGFRCGRRGCDSRCGRSAVVRPSPLLFRQNRIRAFVYDRSGPGYAVHPFRNTSDQRNPMTSIRIIRTCHPNMKSHPARKQNQVRQLICSTKTQKGSAEIELFSGLTECYPENGRLNRSDEKQKFQL